MQFVTLHQLSRELDKPEKVLRYRFHKLRKQQKLIEGDDFIKEDFIDEHHFIYKIDPIKFIKEAKLSPVLPLDTNGYQDGDQTANNVDTKEQEIVTNGGNQKEISDTKADSQGYQNSTEQDFITTLKERCSSATTLEKKKGQTSDQYG